jgi:hypothetical protein
VTAGLEPTCPPVHRPAQLLDPAATAHGLRGAGTRITGTTRVVEVWLYRDPPPELADVRRWRLTPSPGGVPVGVADPPTIVAMPSPHVELTVVGTPDRGRYRLTVLPDVAVAPSDPPAPSLPFDPLRTWLPVELRPECEDPGGCLPQLPAPRLPGPSPVHDYLARDWRSLRQALVEFLLREHPGADTSPAEPAVALLELFAHAGDLLHYRLDRVATEAYLETARLRTSVRRHARLVDYAVEEAAAATTHILLQTSPGAPDQQVVAGDVVAAPDAAIAFTVEADRLVRAPLGEIAVYDWGEDGCCLPAGSTEAVLVRPRPADPLGVTWLAPGDLLAFEVVDPEDADRHRRWARLDAGIDWPAETGATGRFREPLASRTAQVVLLTEVRPFADPLAPGLPLFRVRWRDEDALGRAYPVGVDSGAGGAEVVVARANLVPAHHGRLVDGPAGAVVAPREEQPPGADAPVEFSLLGAGVPARGGVGVALRQDGTPYRMEVRVTLPSGGEAGAEVVPSLLLVPPTTLAAVLDVEDHEPPVLRFRTGAVGLTPPAGSQVAAAYEIGGGNAGNVAAGTLRSLERNTGLPGTAPAWGSVEAVAARNPAAATGGRDAVPLDVVRRDAPEAFAARPLRAVLPADHAAAAAQEPGVQRAVSARAWSGSWPMVRTVVDLLTDRPAPDRLDRISATLDDLRLLGTEVAVVSGTPIGLVIGLEVCATPGADAADVRRRILLALRPGTDARRGLFHPSRLALGQAVYLSATLATAAAIPGVDAVDIREARRIGEPAGTVHQVIEVGPAEVAVLDDDPARPQRGRLDVVVRGGRR